MKNNLLRISVVLFLCCIAIVSSGFYTDARAREQRREAMVGADSFLLPTDGSFYTVGGTLSDGTDFAFKYNMILYPDKNDPMYETHVRRLPDLEPQLSGAAVQFLVEILEQSDGHQWAEHDMTELEKALAEQITTRFFEDSHFILEIKLDIFTLLM